MELAAKPAKPPMNKTMMAWLNVRRKREEQIKEEQSDPSGDEEQDKHNEAKRKCSDGSPIGSPAKRPRFREFKKALRQSPGSSGSDVKSGER